MYPWLLYLLLFCSALLQASPVQLSEVTTALKIPTLEVHKDTHSRFDAEDLSSSNGWQECDCNHLVPGEGYYWLRFEVQSQQAGRWFFKIDNSLIAESKAYLFRQDQFSSQLNPNQIIDVGQPFYPLDLSSNEKIQVYIKLNSDLAFKAPVSIWHQSTLPAYVNASSLSSGGLLGIVLAFLLLNLTILAATREVQLASLILYVASLSLFYLTQAGYLLPYLSVSMSYLNAYVLQIMLVFCVLTGSLFSIQFLQSQRQQKNAFSTVAFVMLAYLFLLPFVPVFQSIGICLVIFVCFLLISLWSGIAEIKAGSEGAEYFVLASVCYLIGLVLHSLFNFGFTESTVAGYALQAFTPAVILLYTVAIYMRMSQQRDASEEHVKETQASQLAAASEVKHLRGIYNKAPEALFEFNQVGVIQEYNSAFAHIVGVSSSKIKNQEIRRLLIKDEDSYSVFSELLQRDGRVTDFVFKLIRNEIDSWISISVTDVSSKVSGKKYEAVAIDITKRVSADNKLHREDQCKLEKQQKKIDALSALLKIIAHEINVPVDKSFELVNKLDNRVHDFEGVLSSGMVTLNELRGLVNDCEVSSELARISLREATKMIQDLNLMVDVGKDVLVRVDVGKLLAARLEDVKTQAHKMGHRFQWMCPAGIKVDIDAEILINVIRGLIKHALDNAFHEGDSGVVELRVSEGEGEVCFTLSDNGMGLNTAQKKVLSNPMLSTAEESGQAHGVEVFMAYNLVKLKLQGAVECLSEEDEGTTFVISVPTSVAQ